VVREVREAGLLEHVREGVEHVGAAEVQLAWVRCLQETADDVEEGYHEMAEAEAQQGGTQELLKRWNPVAHAALASARAEAEASSSVPHWLRLHSSGRHARSF